jgi:hypothetical protein
MYILDEAGIDFQRLSGAGSVLGSVAGFQAGPPPAKIEGEP